MQHLLAPSSWCLRWRRRGRRAATTTRTKLHGLGDVGKDVHARLELPSGGGLDVHILVPALALDSRGIAADANRQQIRLAARALRRRRDDVIRHDVADAVAHLRLRILAAAFAVAAGRLDQRGAALHRTVAGGAPLSRHAELAIVDEEIG